MPPHHGGPPVAPFLVGGCLSKSQSPHIALFVVARELRLRTSGLRLMAPGPGFRFLAPAVALPRKSPGSRCSKPKLLPWEEEAGPLC
jgi:hypothetical protein